MKKSVLWYYHRPGMVYAESFRFKRPVSEREARRYIREYFGYRKLPKESAVWPA
jgi:transposase-like protein